MNFLSDEKVRNVMKSAGVSAEAELDMYIRTLNGILEGWRTTMPDMCIGIHLCRGNLTVSLT